MGLKTTYYLRTLGATAIEKSTGSSSDMADMQTVTPALVTLEAVGVTVPSLVSAGGEIEVSAKPKKVYTEAEKVMCSILDGPNCEACQ